jgi:hypothetical protein
VLAGVGGTLCQGMAGTLGRSRSRFVDRASRVPGVAGSCRRIVSVVVAHVTRGRSVDGRARAGRRRTRWLAAGLSRQSRRVVRSTEQGTRIGPGVVRPRCGALWRGALQVRQAARGCCSRDANGTAHDPRSFADPGPGELPPSGCRCPHTKQRRNAPHDLLPRRMAAGLMQSPERRQRPARPGIRRRPARHSDTARPGIRRRPARHHDTTRPGSGPARARLLPPRQGHLSATHRRVSHT